MKCPDCGTECEPYAEVDIGVGVMQGGPWGCPACHWVESEDGGVRELEEGWDYPDSDPLPEGWEEA